LNLEVKKQAVERTLFGTRYQEIQATLSSFNEEVAELSTIDRALFSVPDTLEYIRDLIPKSVVINAFEYQDEALTVSLQGVAETRESLLDLQKALEASLLVKEVNVPLSNFDSKSQISFSMEIFLTFSQLPYYANSTK